MKAYNRQAIARQSGFTLIELTVVLLILIGLAGLSVPYVGGYVGKTHDSTGVSNQAGLDETIQRFTTAYMKAPNNLEALINGAAATTTTATDCSGAAANAVYCKLMYTSFFTTQALAAPRLASLNSAGITSLYYNDPDTDNATFASTVPLPTTLVAGSTVATVTIPTTWSGIPANATGTIEDYLADVFGRPASNFDGTCYDYVGFGIGESSELTGRVLSTAPVHFASQGAMGPVNKYNRFIAIYQVDRLTTASAAATLASGAQTSGCMAGTEPAKFIGTVMAMGAGAGHLWGLAHSQGHAYENIANGN